MVKLDMLLDIFAFSLNLRLAVSINKRVALFVTDGYTSGRTKSGSCSSACIICLCDNGFTFATLYKRHSNESSDLNGRGPSRGEHSFED